MKLTTQFMKTILEFLKILRKLKYEF